MEDASLTLATPSPLAPALRIIGATDTLGALLVNRYEDKPLSARILLERNRFRDPRLARVLIAAHRTGALAEALIVVSALSAQDPRLRPLDRRLRPRGIE